MAILYTAHATSIGGRDGGVRTDDGFVDLKLAVQKELGGPGGAANPEDLFAAGYAACFHSALKLVAGQEKISLRDSVVKADVGIGPTDAGGFALEADLTVTLPGIEPAKAQELVEAAHRVCPYSNATRNNIPVRLHVETPARASVN
jgi:Ohr subfamily peroxiredoxin